MKIKLQVLLSIITCVCVELFADQITADFAEQCDKEIGVSVPDFNCDHGTTVPTTRYGNPWTDYGFDPFFPPSDCDRPNVLNKECDPGSKFQVLENTPDVFIVAHCRREGFEQGKYGDIAVIQHNKTTGATCFYQSPVREYNGTNPNSGLDNWVLAPKTGSSVLEKNTQCLSCHDNGPLIRSPYLTQIKTGNNVIPGLNDIEFTNQMDQPYYLVGEEDKKTWTVHVEGNDCVSCHALSVWTYNSAIFRNSAGHILGYEAVRPDPFAKLPFSTTSPVWMSSQGPADFPGNSTGNSSWDSAAAASFSEIEACADSFTDINNPPDSDSCRVTQREGKRQPYMHMVTRDGKCVAIDEDHYDSTPQGGGQLETVDCDANADRQTWKYDDFGLLVSPNGKCLRAATHLGVKVAITSSCLGVSNRKWEYDALTGSFKSDYYNECLEVSGGSLTLSPCSTSTNQRMKLSDLKYIRIVNAISSSEVINNQAGGGTILDSGPAPTSYWSADWTIEPSGEYYRIRNRWAKNKFIYRSGSSALVGTVSPTSSAALWEFRARPEEGPRAYFIRSAQSSSPYYLKLDSSNNLDIDWGFSGKSYWNLVIN